MPAIRFRELVGLLLVLLVALVVFWQALVYSPAGAWLIPIAPSPTPAQFSTVQAEVIERAKQHLRDHAQEYYIDKPDLSNYRVSRFVDGGLEYHIWFQEMYHGFPVFGNDIGVHIRPDQGVPPSVTGAGNPRPQVVLRNATAPYPGPYPGPDASALSPKLSAKEAAARAFIATGASRRASSPAHAGLFIYPVGKAGKQQLYTLAWRISLFTVDPLGDWQVLVDAMTGEILAKGNRHEPMPTAPGSSQK